MAALDRVEQLPEARLDRDRRRRTPGAAPAAVGPRSWSSTSRVAADDARAGGDQPVRAGGEPRRDRPGHGEHRPPHLRREVGGRQRAGPLRGLDDHRQRRERRDDPVAGDEAPAEGGEPGRQLGDDAARARRAARTGAAATRGTARPPRRPGRRPAPAGPGGSSAPTCAAESMPSAMPETTGTPAAARLRPSARAISIPYGVPRRAPTIATAASAASASARPATCSTAGASASSCRPAGIAVVAAADQPEPRPLGAVAGAGGRERGVAALGAAGRVEREQVLVGQREHPGGRRAPAPLDVEPRRDRGDQLGPAQARVAGAHRRPPRQPRAGQAARVWAGSSIRRDAARRMWSGPTASSPSRSAIVLATRRMRPCPRADRRLRSWSS